MPASDPNLNDLEKREADLKARELEVKLREMELEIDRRNQGKQTAITPSSPRSIQKTPSWWRLTIEGLKFFAVVVLVVAAIRVAFWLAGAMVVVGVSYVIYKLYFASSFKRKD